MSFLRAILNKDKATARMCEALNIELVEVSSGEVRFTAVPSEHHMNFVGSLHGGYLVTLLDTAMGCACHSMLGAAQSYVTVELKTNFLRGVSALEHELRATGKVVRKGHNVAFTEGSVIDSHGKLVATATSTCLIRSTDRSA